MNDEKKERSANILTPIWAEGVNNEESHAVFLVDRSRQEACPGENVHYITCAGLNPNKLWKSGSLFWTGLETVIALTKIIELIWV